MRPIDADALIAWIKGSQQMTSKMKCVIAKIETMPNAVSVVHGEWIHDGSVWTYRFNCTNCGYHLLGKQTNFCPSCGADMRQTERSE